MNKKRILIISEKGNDVSTEKVMDWITHSRNICERLNGDSFENPNKKVLLKFNKGINIQINNKNLPYYYHSVWFRRWSKKENIDFLIKLIKEKEDSHELLVNILFNKLNDESIIQKLIIDKINSKKKLTQFSQSIVNKIEVSIEAKNCGLLIPEYIITNSRIEVEKFMKTYNNIITKDLDLNFSHTQNDKIYLYYTTLINKNNFSKIPSKFSLSLFQRYVEKYIELRIFFLHKKYFSMAIFSQNNKNTKVDFRNYDFEKPNRTIPFNLPKKIENLLSKLMKRIKLETGSIDMILDVHGNYYFLEVNPVGQFGMISGPCNYNIENEIARFLCK